MNPRQAVEQSARESYSRLLAFLATRAGGDVAGAEDALSEAFAAALRQWPVDGVPHQPDAWLLTIARRRLMDSQRRTLTRTRAMDELTRAIEAAQAVVDASHDFPDERLKLLFVCAHPAIDPAARTPLMLQTVLGLEAERIASAFLTSSLAMGQRLVRAKAKIRAAGIPFSVPPREEWPERLDSVLDAVYAAFTAGWESQADLADEALWLARVLSRLLPDEPEVLGLLALLMHCHARRNARLQEGVYIALLEQDTALWDTDLISQAETVLRLAARHQSPGRFQLEAAIQSVHARRGAGEPVRWSAIAGIYDVLVRHTPALGARIGRAIAHAMSRDVAAGMALLDELPQETLRSHQPYWAARAQLLADSGRTTEASAAYHRAIALSDDPATRRFLTGRMEALNQRSP